jgi:hypothetical protein
MPKKVSAFQSQANTNAAAVATAMAGGVTTAEMQGIAEILKVMALRPDLAAPILKLCDQTKTLPEFG